MATLNGIASLEEKIELEEWILYVYLSLSGEEMRQSSAFILIAIENVVTIFAEM